MKTDVLIITPQFSPDMLKDVIVLKSQFPNLHCTLLMGARWWGQESLAAETCDEVIEYDEAGVVTLLEKLNSISAKTTIIRGARTFIDVAAAIFCPGKLVFRSEEWLCAVPGYNPSSNNAIIERFLVEHADAIYHYWNEDAAAVISKEMTLNGPIETIMPAYVEDLNPKIKLPKLSATDNAPHVVFAADIVSSNGKVEHINKWRVMCDQGIHVHYYSPRPKWRNEKIAEQFI